MKKSLLLSTALVAVFAATQAFARDIITGEVNISNIENKTEESFDSGYGTVYSVTSTGTLNIENSYFANKTNKRGAGVIYSKSKSLKIEGTSFVENSAKTDGGAIFLNGELNYTSDKDLAVANINNSTFKNNKLTAADVGGAISVGRNTKAIISNSIFEGNTADNGWSGAIYSYASSNDKYGLSKGGILDISNSKFINNSALGNGAIGAFSETKLDSVDFIGNKATGTEADEEGAGALFLGAVSKTQANNLNFEANTSVSNGGAIATRTGQLANNSNAELSLVNSVLRANSAEKNGGAVYNTFYKSSIGDYVNISSTIFEENKAGINGGAVYNNGEKDKGGNVASILFADSTFTNNVAGSEGGAVYNMKNAAINFSGNNVFSGNTAGGKANDIHNEGAINVAGDFTLDGGISGDGTITFAKGSNLSVKVNKTAIANNVVNNGATLNMIFDTGFEGEYQLVTGSLDKEFDGYNNNALYNIESSKNGTYQISKKTAQEISEAVAATQNEANVIAALTANESTGHAKSDLIANSVNEALQSGDAAKIAAAKEAASALAPEVVPVVPQTETMVAKQVYNAIGTRLSGGINSANQGISSGDMLDDAAVWVQGLYNKSKLNNTSKAYGYDADTYGTAFGLEKFVTKSVKLGAGYAYNYTDIDGHNRDTDVHTSTLFAYGEYKPNNWFVNGIASYGWSDYSETKHSTVDVKSKYDVNTFGLQAMTGYDFNLPQAFTLTPEAGMRYARVEQDGYVDDAGESVKSHNSDIWTGVAGAKLSKAFAADNGMIFNPELRLAATYDLKNDKSNSFVTLANGTSYAVQNTSLKRFGVEVGAGVTANLNDNVELSLGYEGRFREHYQDHTGLINAKYKF